MSVSRGTFLSFLHEAFHDLPQYQVKFNLLQMHWSLLSAWNKRLNLTSITDPEQAAWLHYRDSAEVIPFLKPGTVLDIGSGGGFPGVVIAALSSQDTTLLEPRAKRVSFLRTVRAKLGLRNLHIQQGRSTDQPTAQFENAITRATFSSEGDLQACLLWSRRLIALRAERKSDATPIHSYTLQRRTRELALWERE